MLRRIRLLLHFFHSWEKVGIDQRVDCDLANYQCKVCGEEKREFNH